MRAPLAALALASAALVVGCARDDLQTRTFTVRHMDPAEALELAAPYVGTRGELRHTRETRTLTVRSTEDVIADIERLLEQYDRADAVILHFRLIEADGFATPDPALTDVEPALRDVLRYDGYRLVAQTVLRSLERAGPVAQTLHEPGGPYRIGALVHEIDTDEVVLGAELWTGAAAVTGSGASLLSASVSVPPGETVILGTAKADPDGGALILVVEAEVVNPPDPASAAETPSP